jgi:hypothetical protein
MTPRTILVRGVVAYGQYHPLYGSSSFERAPPEARSGGADRPTGSGCGPDSNLWLGPNLWLGSNRRVGSNRWLGSTVQLDANRRVDANCRLSSDRWLGSTVQLDANRRVDANCRLSSNRRLGSTVQRDAENPGVTLLRRRGGAAPHPERHCRQSPVGANGPVRGL